MTVPKDKTPLPRKCLWGTEVEPGVYKTEFDDVITSKEISQGIAGCLMVLICAAGLIGGCTMRVHQEIQKRRSKEENVKTPKKEMISNSVPRFRFIEKLWKTK